jgi:hypothetical protein
MTSDEFNPDLVPQMETDPTKVLGAPKLSFDPAKADPTEYRPLKDCRPLRQELVVYLIEHNCRYEPISQFLGVAHGMVSRIANDPEIAIAVPKRRKGRPRLDELHLEKLPSEVLPPDYVPPWIKLDAREAFINKRSLFFSSYVVREGAQTDTPEDVTTDRPVIVTKTRDERIQDAPEYAVIAHVALGGLEEVAQTRSDPAETIAARLAEVQDDSADGSVVGLGDELPIMY